jgi:hypothetical protein
MRPGGQPGADQRDRLVRRTDVRKARIIRPAGIPGVYWVLVNGAQSQTMARGSSTYKPGAMVPIGSEQGETLQTILQGGIAAQGGMASFPVERPPRIGITGEQAVVESCDPASLFTGSTVTVSCLGRGFNRSHTVVIVVWQDEPIPGWTPDARVDLGNQMFIDATRIDFVITIPSDFPTLPDGLVPLTVTVE